jgi:hypothetical protein
MTLPRGLQCNKPLAKVFETFTRERTREGVRLTLRFGTPTKWPMRRPIWQARSLASKTFFSYVENLYSCNAIFTIQSISLDQNDPHCMILRPVCWDESCMLDNIIDLAQCHSNTLDSCLDHAASFYQYEMCRAGLAENMRLAWSGWCPA